MPASPRGKTSPDGLEFANELETLGFEEALNRLGRTVESLEAGDLGLDAALAHYEEGVRLLRRCRALLDGAESRVALLTGLTDDGVPQTEPFDTQATADRTVPPAGTAPVSPAGNKEVWPDPDEADEDDAPF